MMMLVIQIGLILFFAKLGGKLFEYFKLPGLLGELVIGIIIGPYLLGSLAMPGFPNGLFPLEGDFPVTTELYGIATIASILLLFMAGIETDLGLFLKYSVVGSFVGLGGIIASFAFGMGISYLFSKILLKNFYSLFSPQSLFLGVMSAATSVGITARILSEKKKMETPEGVTILAGAVIDDVGGIIALAIVLGIVGSTTGKIAGGFNNIGIVAIKAIGIWLIATLIGILSAHRISFLLKLFKTKTSISVLAFGLSLIVAGLFEEAGLAMIIGAYVTGLSLSNTDIKNVIHEVLHPLYEFFIPIFFCVMGMLVDIRTFASIPIITFGIIYTIAAILAKIVGCGLPAFAFGFNTKGAIRVGTGMVPRGEVALIIAGIGISGGFIDQRLFGVSVMMTLLTTLSAPSLLISSFNIPGVGTKKKVEVSEVTTFNLNFASNELSLLMMQNILKFFEEEKYFVSILNPEEEIYQMRKNRYIITVSRENKEISFSYKKEDEGIILASLIDVFANVEKMLRGLKVPLDQNNAIKKLLARKEENILKIDPQYIKAEHIIMDLKGKSKEDIIQELLGVIIEDYPSIDFADAFNELMKRESEMSTGLTDGIAIPHAKIEGIDRIICSFGIHREGIDFKSLDGKPSKFFFLILSPISGSNRLELLSQIARTMTEQIRKEILEAKTAEEILDILTQ
jgi:Kef-type K+ transport system membrane component KefB/mannitol/fructose-specific phosphotransferase system IIA component (Ntr-type)